MILFALGNMLLKKTSPQKLKKVSESTATQGAKSFVSREGSQQGGKGGALVRKKPTASQFVGGKSEKSQKAILASDSGGKISFEEISNKINIIIGLTGSIDAIVKVQSRQDKKEAADLRKSREDKRKRMRESLLEDKKVAKKSGSGSIIGPAG